MWYYGAGETGPFPYEGASGVSKDCDLIKKCVTGVELDDGVGDALLFGDCGDENTMKANVSRNEDFIRVLRVVGFNVEFSKNDAKTYIICPTIRFARNNYVFRFRCW